MYIGIDPGLHGAIAVIGKENTNVHDMPIRDGTLDIPALVELMRSYSYFNAVVTLERIHSMPGQGVSSSFKFGEGFGILKGVLTTLGYDIRLVTPQRWKKHFGLIGKDKGASLALARELFPSQERNLRLKKHDGRAEALLLARYGELYAK